MVDGSEDTSEGDIIGQQGKDMMMETVVMEKVQDIFEGRNNVDSGRDNMVCVWLEGCQVNLH